MGQVMYCRACQARWPGHTRCPHCGLALHAREEGGREVRVEDLPQFHDLARQYELGRQEVTPRRARKRRNP